ncbi:MAG: NAD-dependent epimerase/dehydratase family protein [Eubacterium sp.]|nr:NAD-dependent epimerase/dehydratase family protein [Eubacterium sp.]
MAKKILILGGSGFLGSNLGGFLNRHGYEVYSFDLDLPMDRIDGIHYVKGDFFNEKDLEQAVSDMDGIVHAISTIHPGNSNQAYMRGYEKDFLQTLKLCNMLIGKNVKMLFLSSGGTVYGDCGILPMDETVLPRPINHYGNLKLCMENAMRTFNYQFHTRIIVARISNPYGPGQDFRKGVGFIDAALKHAITNTPIEIWGDGENIRDYIYVNDVCRMLSLLIEYQGEYDTFHVSSGTGITQNGIIEKMRNMGLNPKVVYHERRSVDAKHIVLENTRIMNLYKKKLTSLDDGLTSYNQFLKTRFIG